MIRKCLTNERWARIEPELPGKLGDPGRRARDNRLLVEAVLWIARTGSPWRDLPDEFGKWLTVYARFWRWSRKGVWERGFETPVVMGSRATHTRSAMGGIEGRMLREGDVLPAASMGRRDGASFEAIIDAPWLARDPEPFRVVLGPQDDYFTAETLSAFFAGAFTLTPMADRMAYRLDGPDIAHAGGYDIVSDGTALGAIQIAGDKQPLVLMADRQPTGGYPKLGHVARADIGRLAQMRPGENCCFRAASVAEARAALVAREDEIATTVARLCPLRRALTSETLFAANLIGGVVDPLDSERIEGES